MQASGLWPQPGPSAVDIEQFLEIHLNAMVDYAGDLPPSDLGYTEFTTPPRVVVSRTLTDLAPAHGTSLGLRGRWRATLAHEAAHILLHAGLGLVGSSTPKLTVNALKGRRPRGASSHEWWQVQANMGMAALLMPRGPFLESARAHLNREPVFAPVEANDLIAKRLVAVLAEEFQTSHEATRLRLLTFGWIGGAASTIAGLLRF